MHDFPFLPLLMVIEARRLLKNSSTPWACGLGFSNTPFDYLTNEKAPKWGKHILHEAKMASGPKPWTFHSSV